MYYVSITNQAYCNLALLKQAVYHQHQQSHHQHTPCFEWKSYLAGIKPLKICLERQTQQHRLNIEKVLAHYAFFYSSRMIGSVLK